MIDNELKNLKNTDEWDLYQKNKNYLSSRSFYDNVNKFIRFYSGDQWHGANLGDMPKVQYNFIKPVVKYKTSNLDAKEYEIVFMSNNYDSIEEHENMDGLCTKLNSHLAVIWELAKLDKECRKMKKDAAITGEGILYLYYKPIDDKKETLKQNGEDRTRGEENIADSELMREVVNGEVAAEALSPLDVLYGNENDNDIQNQPYILIKKRMGLKDVIALAISQNVSQEEIDNIVTDKEVNEEIGDNSQHEVDDQVLVITKLYKENGTVHMSQSTKTVVIKKDIDLGLKYYPMVHMLWEEEYGSARGKGEVEPLISNQIETNKTLMRRAMVIKNIAFPKPVVNIEKIKNPSAINKVGATIELHGGADNINNYFGYIQPTQTSGEAVALQNELITMSRELANASDAVTGSVNPENASGKAILAVQEAAQQPLTEQLYNFKDALVDMGLIIFDIWRAYNVEGMRVFVKKNKDDLKKIDDGKTEYEMSEITTEQLDRLKPFVKIEITPKSAYDRYAQEQSFENLLVKGLITFEEYVELLTPDSVMNKRSLIMLVQKRQAKQQQIQEMQEKINNEHNMLENELKTEQMANQVEVDTDINDIQNKTAMQANQILGGNV